VFEQRIILVNGSRLLHELLNRALHKSDHLRVVKEIAGQNELPDADEQYEAEWMVISLPADSQFPKWIDLYLKEHPSMRVMAFASDGSEVKMRWLEKREESISDPSLQDLIHILESDQRTFQISEKTVV